MNCTLHNSPMEDVNGEWKCLRCQLDMIDDLKHTVSILKSDLASAHDKRLAELLTAKGAAILDEQKQELAIDSSAFGLAPVVESVEVPTVEMVSRSKRLAFESIKRLCPLDRFVEEAEKDDIMRLAVEIVYGNIPMSDWGSDTAERLIGNLYKQFLKQAPILEGEEDKEPLQLGEES